MPGRGEASRINNLKDLRVDPVRLEPFVPAQGPGLVAGVPCCGGGTLPRVSLRLPYARAGFPPPRRDHILATHKWSHIRPDAAPHRLPSAVKDRTCPRPMQCIVGTVEPRRSSGRCIPPSTHGAHEPCMPGEQALSAWEESHRT